MKKTASLTLRLSEELVDFLNDTATKTGIKPSTLARIAIEDYRKRALESESVTISWKPAPNPARSEARQWGFIHTLSQDPLDELVRALGGIEDGIDAVNAGELSPPSEAMLEYLNKSFGNVLKQLERNYPSTFARLMAVGRKPAAKSKGETEVAPAKTRAAKRKANADTHGKARVVMSGPGATNITDPKAHSVKIDHHYEPKAGKKA